jgi:hypothetical protein
MRGVTLIASLALAASCLAAPAPTNGQYQEYPKSSPLSQQSNDYQTEKSTWPSSQNKYTGKPMETESSWSSKKTKSTYEQNTWPLSGTSTHTSKNTYLAEPTYTAQPTYGIGDSYTNTKTYGGKSPSKTFTVVALSETYEGGPPSSTYSGKLPSSTYGGSASSNTYGDNTPSSTYGGGSPSSYGGDENTYSASSDTKGASGSMTGSQPVSATGTSNAVTGNGTTAGGTVGNLGIPTNCLKHGNIPVGWLPDQDHGGTMEAITSKLGATSCFYGLYSQIKGSTYDDTQLTSQMDNIKRSGAVFQPAVMPTNVKFSDITSDLAGQIAASMKKFTDEGITVWLRFAHEVNWYVQDGTYVGGSAEEFKTAWQNVANAVKDNDKVLMYWSPNNVADASDLDQWFPGAQYVDVVGIDIYPKDDKLGDFKGVYGNFYDKFSAPNNIPFAVGETAAGGTEQQKKWLTSLANGDESMPNYVGFAWFEYDKEKDWRVVTGPNGDIAGPILKGGV